MSRPAAPAILLAAALVACSDTPPLFPSVDLVVLPPVGAAAAGAPETPDYPPPDEPDPAPDAEPEPEPTPEPDPDAEPEPEPESEPVAEPESASDPGSESAPDPDPPASLPPSPSASLPAPARPARTHRVVSGAGFSYAIPAAWRELDAASLGVPTLVTAQRATSPIDGFVTNVTVAVEPFDGDVGAYGSLHLAAIVDGGALRDAWPTWIGLHDALDVEAGWSNLAGMPYLTLQRYVVDGRRAYVITCAAAATAWAAERPPCEEIIESLRLD